MLTGGDVVSARFLFRESFEFRPQAKLWLVANTKPRVSNEDGAMWRRIRLIPFEHTIPEGERDPEVKLALRDPAVGGPAVLAWAVRGCVAWLREGLEAPERVTRATANAAYVGWARDANERRVLASREFGQRLGAHGVGAEKGTHGARLRSGIRLRINEPLASQVPV